MYIITTCVLIYYNQNICMKNVDSIYICTLLLQYNNVNFLTITPEKASTELNKPCAFVRMQAQYNPASKLCNANCLLFLIVSFSFSTHQWGPCSLIIT